MYTHGSNWWTNKNNKSLPLLRDNTPTRSYVLCIWYKCTRMSVGLNLYIYVSFIDSILFNIFVFVCRQKTQHVLKTKFIFNLLLYNYENLPNRPKDSSIRDVKFEKLFFPMRQIVWFRWELNRKMTYHRYNFICALLQFNNVASGAFPLYLTCDWLSCHCSLSNGIELTIDKIVDMVFRKQSIWYFISILSSIVFGIFMRDFEYNGLGKSRGRNWICQDFFWQKPRPKIILIKV